MSDLIYLRCPYYFFSGQMTTYSLEKREAVRKEAANEYHQLVSSKQDDLQRTLNTGRGIERLTSIFRH